MFNLLRMDLYRLKRSRYVYICLGILLLLTSLAYWMVWLESTPQGRETAMKLGMVEIEADSWPQYDTVSMFQDVGMSSGAYNTILGIVIALFVCVDFGSGFIKNIMSLHRQRWKYIGSKLLTAGILSFFYIILQYGFSLLLNQYFDRIAAPAALTDILFYLSKAWFLTVAFASLVILVCVLARSIAIGILGVIAFSSGLLVQMLSFITGLFGINKWTEYTLYYSLTYAPTGYTGIGDLKGVLIGFVFLSVYSFLAMVSLSRRDI